MITFEVDDLAFRDYLKRVEHMFVYMTRTMIEVAEEVKKETQMETPIKTGRLSRSFKWEIVTDNSRMKVFHITMSALNPKTGYDYAYTQHRGYHTSKEGRKVYYHHKIIDLGFYTHRSDFDGGYEKKTWGSNVSEIHHGSNKYLYWGIKHSTQSAFEMIETDYLSLFQMNGVYLGGLY